jgi:hypothetical protein
MKVTVLRLKCDLGVRRYRASSAGSMTMPDGRLWLIRDAYTAETAWAPRHVGKELRHIRPGRDLEATQTGDHLRRAHPLVTAREERVNCSRPKQI